MTNIEDIIRYENEGTSVDFKTIEYTKEKNIDLLKDVLSMANADTLEDRFIIIGVKHNSDGKREIKGINQPTDSATIQQFIYENIEPEIDIDYFPYTIDDKTVGILKISNCLDQPYLIKKDYNFGNKHLRKGEGYIRKGSFQIPLVRSDYDRIYEIKQSKNYYQDDIIIVPQNANGNEFILRKAGNTKLPSKVQKDKIEEILAKKKEEAKLYNSRGTQCRPELYNMRRIMAESLGYGISYEDYTIDELENELLNVESIYYHDDYSYFFNKKSNKLNLSIKNCGSKYIEDATIKILFPKINGIIIFKKMPHSNKEETNINLFYPTVGEEELMYSIENNIGDIKHGLSTDSFKEELRISVMNNIEINEFEIECQIYAKNIKDYISRILKVRIQSEDC